MTQGIVREGSWRSARAGHRHRWNSYYCAIEPRDDQIEVVVGDRDPAVLLLDRAGGLISRHPIEMAGMIAIESVLPAGNRLYLSFGSSFLNMLFAPGVVALERPSYAVAARGRRRSFAGPTSWPSTAPRTGSTRTRSGGATSTD